MYLLALHEVGGAENCAIAKVSATGVIKQKNSHWLACNGGHMLRTNQGLESISARKDEFCKEKGEHKS